MYVSVDFSHPNIYIMKYIGQNWNFSIKGNLRVLTMLCKRFTVSFILWFFIIRGNDSSKIWLQPIKIGIAYDTSLRTNPWSKMNQNSETITKATDIIRAMKRRKYLSSVTIFDPCKSQSFKISIKILHLPSTSISDTNILLSIVMFLCVIPPNIEVISPSLIVICLFHKLKQYCFSSTRWRAIYSIEFLNQMHNYTPCVPKATNILFEPNVQSRVYIQLSNQLTNTNFEGTAFEWPVL